MSPFFAVFLVLLLASSCYAAGRLHGQLSYRSGYRCGYRQGYFDGDRGAWNRRHRQAQAAAGSSALVVPSIGVAPAVVGQGTTYLGASFAGAAADGGRHSFEALPARRG
jgi:hypothetical protein